MERPMSNSNNSSPSQLSKSLSLNPPQSSTTKNHQHVDEGKEEELLVEENEEDEDDLEMEDDNNRRRSCSSNSTIEENGSKRGSGSGGSVRQYVRSKTPRLRWTPDLHLCFIRAIERLGGQERATPKLVLQMMNVKGLSIAHVKSHLQMYRSKKIEDPTQVNSDQGFFFEGGDHQHHIYSLSQLPMLQNFNQWSNSSGLRYGDSSLRPGQRYHDRQIFSPHRSVFDHSPKTGHLHGFYGSISERLFRNNHNTLLGSPQIMSPRTSPSWRSRNQVSEDDNKPFCRSSSSFWKSTQNIATDNNNNHNPMRSRELSDHQVVKSNIIASNSSTSTASIKQLGQPTNKLKRKALDSEHDDDDNGDLDLDLSLKIAPKETGFGGQVDQIVGDSALTALSLSTSNLSSSNVVTTSKSSKEESGVTKRGKVLASTLDLTL